MKYEIEITNEFNEALTKIIHNALLHGGATLLNDVNNITKVLSNLKEINND